MRDETLDLPPVRAPNFPEREWFNTERPLQISDLRGKLVILDFWTFCCINCIHLLPQLAEVERQFPDEVMVIGVHSAKFPAERAGGSLRSAIQRHEVEHPVINDEDLDIWGRYAIRAWPTLLFIDPNGRIIGRHEGEISAAALVEIVRNLVERYDADGLIDRTPIPGLRPMERPASTLSFPGKVLADAQSDRLIIADSGHHRIIVSALDGTAPQIIGSGTTGLSDGPSDVATFNQPQGLALDGNHLYVADTRNHAIRHVDLETGEVSTIAGTGEPGWGNGEPGPALSVPLRSPWGLALHGRTLFFAMAGTHQVWALELDEAWLRPYAGSGREGIRDERLERAWLAQPSGLATDGKRLYVADSETSAIRTITLPPGDEVRTLVGTGLFDFGDVDGTAERARLQHPLDIALGEGVLYVADSYNHKIKRLYPAERRIESWLGNGEPGNRDGAGADAQFHEPSGLSLAGDRLYIADTNNHAIRVVDLGTGQVTTLRLAL